MKSISVFLSLAAMSALTAKGAIIVQYIAEGGNTTTGTVPAADWHDNVQNSPTAYQGYGGVVIQQAGSFEHSFAGYSATGIDLTKYAGFKFSVEPGYQVNFENLQFVTRGGTSGSGNSYQWGYRIDLDNNGDFSGAGEAWVLGNLYVAGVTTGFNGVAVKTWDLAGVTATGTIEFGLFASTPNELNNVITGRNIVLNGTVSQVPEPSAMLLGALGGLALLRRRR